MAAGRTIARNSVFLGLAFGFSKLFSLAITAIAGRVLGPAVYGLWGTGTTIIEVGRIFASAGLDLLVSREVASDPTRANHVGTNSATLKLITGAIVYPSLVGISIWLGYPREVMIVVLILGSALFLENLSDTFDAIFQGVQKMHVTTVAFVTAGAFLLPTAALALFGGFGLAGLATCFAASFALRLIVMIVVGRRTRVVKLDFSQIDKAELDRLAKAAGPLLAATVLAVVFHRMDILMLSRMVVEEDVGFYIGAVRIIDVVVLLPRILATAVYPALRRHRDESVAQATALVGDATRVSLILCSAAALAIWWIAPWAMRLVLGPEFVGGTDVLRLLCWGILFQGGAHMLARLLLAIDAERDFLVVATVSLVTNLGLNLWLIPRLGIEGAALATLAAYAMNVILYVLATRRHGYRVSALRNLGGPAAAIGVAALIGFTWEPSSTLLRAAVMLVAWLGFLVITRTLQWRDVHWTLRLLRKSESI